MLTEDKNSEAANNELIKDEKFKAISSFARDLSNELNNILTTNLGNISLAKLYLDTNSKDKVFNALNEAEKSAFMAKSLAYKISQLDINSNILKEKVSINELLNEVTNSLKVINIKVQTKIENDIWDIDVNKEQIIKVFQNIIINSFEAISENGEVKVNAENIILDKNNNIFPIKNGKYVKFSIIDNGLGIPENYFEKIFEPYFTTKELNRGFGLPISYSILKAHDGYIFVDNNSEIGVTFNLYIPKYLN